MSVILRPKRNDEIQLLPLVGAFAVADGIMKDTGLVPFVRWPNDVLLEGKKIAGIIAESAYRGKNLSYAIVGIGINCNARADSLGEYSQFSTSLKEQLGVEVDLSILRDRVLDCFAPFYSEWERSGKIVGRRKDWISTIGKKVEITRGDEKAIYLAEDVREDGSLVVSSGRDRLVLRV
jgi:BirA family biotin operon repressor/biotin-[acetyl-CoA-carboxylase] ligase